MRKLYFYYLFVLIFSACQNDDGLVELPKENLEEENETPDVEEELAGEIEFYNNNLTEDSYVLVNDPGNDRVYVMDKSTARIVFEWDLEYNLGNDAELMSDGNLLVSFAAEDPAFSFGGFGGKLAIIRPDGSTLWEYDYDTESQLAHHDVEMLPNGNVLFIAWEKKEGDVLASSGYNGEEDALYVETVIEINPFNDEIVWKWSSWDHLVQDFDEQVNNFGVISHNPQKIDINYRDPLIKEISFNGDIMHANGLEYDPVKDIIYLSVNYFSEVWVIDHSTSTDEASTDLGGKYGKGGDLLYRFGNPSAYKNSVGTRTFFSNHSPNLVDGTNNMLIYINGNLNDIAQSTVYELLIPNNFDMMPNSNNELPVIWSFTDKDLFSPKVSSAYRLKNGNTLITEGTYGFWEVTKTKEVVWKFHGQGFYWRGYGYRKNDQAILNLGL